MRSGILRSSNRAKKIKMEQKKMKGILDWPAPKEVKDIQKFLELTNYYQQFIRYFAMIARLLYDMVKKDQKQEQTEKQEEAFSELKERFTKELVLVVPDLDKKNENGSRCVGLCYRRGFKYRM